MNERHLTHDWFAKPIPPNVQIGPRSWLYSTFAFLHYRSERPTGLRIGHDSGLYHGTFLDLGPHGEVDIGDFCTIVGAIIATNGRVVIEDYSFLAHEVVIADHYAATPFIENGNYKERPRSPDIHIGENVWIGARAVLLGDITIGEGSVIGAAAVVTDDVPAYTIAAGNPARVVGHIRH